MLLPAEFIAFAGLDSIALFAGIGRSFQLWRPEHHQSREKDTRQQVSKQGVPRLTLGRQGASGDR
jgi:MraZ protein